MNTQDLASFSWYTGHLEWLPRRTIFLAKAGSHAYGTNTPTSDLDLKGIAVAPMHYYLGALDKFEQAEVKVGVDATIYDVKKFFALAWANNPNILEQLWTDEADWVLPNQQLIHASLNPNWFKWRHILDNRDHFLSQKCLHTFSGYAHAQLDRIRSHRAWLLNPPKKQPDRADFGLKPGEATLGKDQLGVVNAVIRKKTDEFAGQGWTKDKIEACDEHFVEIAVHDLNLSKDLVKVILAERRFAAACKNWQAYQTWKKERNPVRAELEAKFGYDTKHGMHLVRLLRMGTEILEGKGVLVKRPDAAELLEIRKGAWTFEAMLAWAEGQERRMNEAVATTKLPHEPNRRVLNNILIRTIESGQT